MECGSLPHCSSQTPRNRFQPLICPDLSYSVICQSRMGRWCSDLNMHHRHLKDFLKHRLLGFTEFEESDSVHLGWSLIVCIFNTFPSVTKLLLGPPPSTALERYLSPSALCAAVGFRPFALLSSLLQQLSSCLSASGRYSSFCG